MCLFTVTIETDGVEHKINYSSIEELISDNGMKSLFNDNLITKCIIHSNGKRLAGLPFMKWEHLIDRVVANSSTILREVVINGKT